MRKKFLITSLAVIATTSFAFATLNVSAERYALTSDLFETQFVTVDSQVCAEDTNDSRVGVCLTGLHNGANATFKDDFAGEFVLDYRLYNDSSTSYGVNELRFIFSAIDSDEEFSVVVTRVGNQRNYAVVTGEDKYSVNGYLSDVSIENEDSDMLSFDPNTYTVAINETEIWSFSKFCNQNYKNDIIFDGFSQYNVTLEFVDTKDDGHALLYSVNGQTLSKEVLYGDVAAPSLYAATKYNGVIGEKYLLGKPYAYDVIDKDIPCSDIYYIIKKDGLSVLEGNYEDGAFFVPEKSGTYFISYTVADEQGLETTLTQEFKIFETKPVVFFEADGVEKNYTIGAGGTIYIPRMSVSSELSNNRDTYVTVSIKKNGVIIDAYDKLFANGFNYTFSAAGNYEIVYEAQYNGFKEETSFTVVVEENKPSLILSEDIPVSVTVGERYKIPNATMKLGESEVEANKTILFPSGAKYKGNYIDLTEYGYYEIEYSATIGEVKYSEKRWLKCIHPTQSLFGDKAKVQVGEYRRSGGILDGVVITETAGKGGVTFAKPIDLSNNTREDILIELAAYPFVAGTRDYRTLRVTLTDIADKNNVVVFDISQPGFGADYTTCYGKVSHSNLPFKGADGSTHDKIFDGGSPWGKGISHSFHGPEDRIIEAGSNTIRISMDYATKRVYFGATTGGLGDGAASDLDSLALYSKEWKGFTDGKCYVSVEIGNFINAEGRYIIKNIGNFDLSGDRLNYSAPEIEVNYEENEQIPTGVKGLKYPLFSATAKDIFSETVKVNANVYYLYGTPNEIEVDVIDGAFTPFLAGNYTIVYSAADGLGNVAQECIDVKVEETVDAFTVQFEQDVCDAFAGIKIPVQSFSYANNRGKVVIKSLTVKNKNDNTVCTVEDDSFITEKAGIYVVEYTLHDWLGREGKGSYEVEVAANPLPVFSSLTLLPVYTIGQSYVLPQITATDYSSGIGGSATDVAVTVTYSDGHSVELGAERTFIPEAGHGDQVTIDYSATATEENKLSATAALVNFDSSSGNLNVSDYFAKNNVNFVATTDRLTVEVIDNTSPASFIFAKPLFAETLALRMLINKESNAYNSLKITLTDSEDLSLKVTLRIIKNTEETSICSLQVNDESPINMAGSFWGLDAQKGSNLDLRLSFKNSTCQILDATQMPIVGVLTDTRGNAFSGFPSKLVYASFEFEEVSTDLDSKAAIDLFSFNAQSLGNIDVDVVKPEVMVEGEYGGMYEYGSELILPTVFGTDVLGYIESMTITMTSADNLPVLAMDGTSLFKADATKSYAVKLEKYGKYKIVYSVTDSNGNTANTLAKIVYVMKDEKPVVTLNGTVESNGKVGETVTLPNVTLPSEDCQFNIVVIDSNFTHTVVFSSKKMDASNEENYQFTWVHKGKHTVRYYVYDEFYNYTMEEYIVNID